jgi:hypothetical protein
MMGVLFYAFLGATSIPVLLCLGALVRHWFEVVPSQYDGEDVSDD